MTEVSEAMFSCEPCALSMRMTASEVLPVVQPARPSAVTIAKTGRTAIFGERRPAARVLRHMAEGIDPEEAADVLHDRRNAGPESQVRLDVRPAHALSFESLPQY